VDTGAILATRPHEYRASDTLRVLEERLADSSAELLAETAAGLDSRSPPRGQPQPSGGGRQYFKMGRAQRRDAARRLREYLAVRQSSAGAVDR
jgi:methionyl-tRNA formyltransferase